MRFGRGWGCESKRGGGTDLDVLLLSQQLSKHLPKLYFLLISGVIACYGTPLTGLMVNGS